MKNFVNLILNKSYIQTNMIYHNSDTYGSDVADNMLFFISNYCYTEISEIYNKNYSHILLPKVKNGFIISLNIALIVFESCGSYSLNSFNTVNFLLLFVYE